MTSAVEIWDGHVWRDTLTTEGWFHDGQQGTQILPLQASGLVRQIWTGTEWWPVVSATITRVASKPANSGTAITWTETITGHGPLPAFNAAGQTVATMAGLGPELAALQSAADAPAFIAAATPKLKAWAAGTPLESFTVTTTLSDGFVETFDLIDLAASVFSPNTDWGIFAGVAKMTYESFVMQRDSAGNWSITALPAGTDISGASGMKVTVRAEDGVPAYTVTL